MGRLIDEDKLMQDVNNTITEKSGAIDWINLINCQSTAYDPDKVVEQLEEIEKIMTSPVSQDCFGEECKASDCTVCLISRAIEIVKGGGVDG